MSTILECKNIHKSYGKKKALDDITFSIESGKIVGLFGINGCGKTTLLKSFAGMLQIDSGDIKIDGHEIGADSKKITAYAPDRVCFNERDTVEYLVDFYNTFFEDFDKEMAIKSLETHNINIKEKMAKLSKGNAEKVQIILTMSRRCKLYILDEPFDGIDAIARESIVKMMLKDVPDESTVIITTHNINEIENMLDEAIFLKDGKLLFHKSVDDLREEYGKSVNDVFKEVLR